MAESTLKDRLRDHSKAFNGLLSLIPAKMYYAEDTSDQWNKKKQTKQEAAAARRGKLDPDSVLNQTAKEAMDERARNKRKLKELEKQEDADKQDNGDDSDAYEAFEGVEPEKPGDGLKKKTDQSNKKQKLMRNDDEQSLGPKPVEEKPKLSKKGAKIEAKREKKVEKKSEGKGKKRVTPHDAAKEENNEDIVTHKADEQEKFEANRGISSHDLSAQTKEDAANVTSASDSEVHSPTFDTNESSVPHNDASVEQASTTTSVSSTVPPSEKPKHIKIPADSSAVRARVAARIEALRAARKALRPRNRQELLEERRTKQAQRAERKKEERKQARQEAARLREEALALNSPGVMSPAIELDDPAGKFSFGRVAFGDGSQMSHDLSYVLNHGKKKGPSDVKTALLKVQNQNKRFQEMEPEKRAEVMEKEAWLTARRRVEGEKIHDSEARLKKAKNRKEAAERKSKKEWSERARGVQHAQKERQKKREENLKKRREDKALGKAGKKKGGAKKKKAGRPGFEGSIGVGGGRK
ncbi:hypothetical protein QQS21_001833 [Conoideocrella luteorostrata]|uniref:Uncharacterized protein n=1 Tax=Conoideocrella luteorostrata TaxID=1105319 RepID=A0AAJ0FXT9_9HYPO|nr:hypothetical protein QQS21_001833 [Conoideocrella luteorostrata]